MLQKNNRGPSAWGRGGGPDGGARPGLPSQHSTPPLLERLLSCLEAVRGPDSGGWYTARCPKPEHHTRGDLTPSFRLCEGGYKCLNPACMLHEGGTLWRLARMLGIDAGNLNERRNGHRPERPPREAPGRAGDPVGWWAEHCGVPRPWLEKLPIEARDGAVAFVWPGLEVAKLRSPSAKGWWEGDGPRPLLWPALPETMPPVLVLCEGESDATVAAYVIDALALGDLAWAAGVTKGAAQRPFPALLRELAARGVRALLVVPDADEAGQEWGKAWADAARQMGTPAATLDLVGSRLASPYWGEKDLRDAFRRQPARAMAALKEAVEALAEGAAGAGFGFVSINTLSVETKPDREARAADLQAQAKTEGKGSLEGLPLLGQPGFIYKGLAHLLAGFPKAGKTELLARAAAEWQGESVLWLTEEPQAIWEARLRRLPEAYGHVTLFFALGCPRQELLERIRQGQESVVILDTLKLLGIDDANDASAVTQALVPFIAACREGGKTLVLAHHERKGGGQHGEGIAGSHAFLGLVDVALELLRDDKAPNRRLLRGYGRVVPIPELAYEMAEDGSLVALGDPTALALQAVKERALALLTEAWQTLGDIMGAMGEPRPSEDQVRRALNALVEEGLAERDPPPGVKGNRAHRWRLRSGPVSTDKLYIETERNGGQPEAPGDAPSRAEDGGAGGLPEAQEGPAPRRHAPSWAIQVLEELGAEAPPFEPEEGPPHPAHGCPLCQPAPWPWWNMGYRTCRGADGPVLIRSITDPGRHLLQHALGEPAVAVAEALLRQVHPAWLVVEVKGYGRGWLSLRERPGQQVDYGEPQRAWRLSEFTWEGRQLPMQWGAEFPDTGGEFPDTEFPDGISGQPTPQGFPDTTEFPDKAAAPEFPDTKTPDIGKTSDRETPDTDETSDTAWGSRQNSGHETPDIGKTSDMTRGHRRNSGHETSDSLACQRCGQPVPRGRRGPPPRWCSDSCRKRAARKGERP